MKKLFLTFFVLSLFNVTFAANNMDKDMGQNEDYQCSALEQSLNRGLDETNAQQIDPQQIIEDAKSKTAG